MINGIPDHRIDEIELRLAGVDHRPWKVSHPSELDDEGRRTVTKGSARAIKKANRIGLQVGAQTLEQSNVKTPGMDAAHPGRAFHPGSAMKAINLFHRTDNATDDMLDFIASAPEDVEELLREVKQLRIMATKYKEGRDAAVVELQGSKIAASRAEGKIVDMRRAWRTLVTEMGTKP